MDEEAPPYTGGARRVWEGPHAPPERVPRGRHPGDGVARGARSPHCGRSPLPYPVVRCAPMWPVLSSGSTQPGDPVRIE
jgi:hypothetical protein